MVHVLIIDGFSPPHKWLIKEKIKTTWFTKSNEINNFYNHDRIIGFPIYSKDEDFISMAKFLHNKDKFTHIFTFRERSLNIAAKIGTELNIPFETIDTIEVINNKYKMRKFLDEKNMSVIKYKEVSCENDVRDFFFNTNNSVILKPQDGNSSKSIFHIKSHMDIESSWNDFKNLGNSIGICEEFIKGEEFSIEAVTVESEHKIISITKKFKNENFVEVGHSIPANLDDNLKKDIERFIFKFLNELQVENSISHSEIIITSQNEIKLVETHLRPGGDMIPDLIWYSKGLNLYDYFLSQSLLNQRKENQVNLKINQTYSAIWFKESKIQGEIIEVLNIEDIRKIEGVQLVIPFKKIGDLAKLATNSSERLCSVIVTAESQEKAIELAQQCVNSIKYIVKANGIEITI